MKAVTPEAHLEPYGSADELFRKSLVLFVGHRALECQKGINKEV